MDSCVVCHIISRGLLVFSLWVSNKCGFICLLIASIHNIWKFHWTHAMRLFNAASFALQYWWNTNLTRSDILLYDGFNFKRSEMSWEDHTRRQGFLRHHLSWKTIVMLILITKSIHLTTELYCLRFDIYRVKQSR